MITCEQECFNQDDCRGCPWFEICRQEAAFEDNEDAVRNGTNVEL